MKFLESLALANAVFVLSGIATAIMQSCGYAATSPQLLVFWILAQAVLTTILLWTLPRKPVTYVQAVNEPNSNDMSA